jgi:MFS family permease
VSTTPSLHGPVGEPAGKRGDGGEERCAEETNQLNQLPPDDVRSNASRSSLQGLDWFTFFIANVQTGFGPFIVVYLTTQKWPQVDIGLLLTVGGLVALLGQAPGGALVDAVRAERVLAALSVAVIGATALVLALWPIVPSVFAAIVLHSAASCVLGPAIAAISLGLVGHAGMAERLGRNARFAALGSGFAAAGMGACGYLWSSQAVFFLTFALCGPTLWALFQVRASEIDPIRAHGGISKRVGVGIRGLLANRTLLVFACCATLFHLSNAALLPLMSSVVTMRSSNWATTMVAACIVVPQLIVAALSPWVGRKAQVWGRRPLLLLGFAATPVRAGLIAITADPYQLVLIQALDGISAAVLGVLATLVIADVTRGTGRFNLAQGMVGTGVGLGASLSTTLAGYMSDQFGSSTAFLGLAGIGAIAFVMLYALMPETRPHRA